MPDNEYDGLSDEEIAALKDDDVDADAGDVGDKPPSESDAKDADDTQPPPAGDDAAPKADDKLGEKGDKDKGDIGDKPQKTDAGADKNPDVDPAAEGAEKAPDAKPKDEGDSAEKAAIPEQKPFVPTLPEVDPEELKSLKEALDEAQKKFTDGDIDYAELDKIKDAYNEVKWTADFAAKSNKGVRETLWQWEQDRFLEDNTRFQKNTTLNAAFVAVVNVIINTEEGAKLTDRQVLAKAKVQVETDLGMLRGTPDKGLTEAEKKQQAIKNVKKNQGDRSNLSADVGSLPSADENVDADPFGYLDKLEGEKYQEAIDKLTPAQLQKYEDV